MSSSETGTSTENSRPGTIDMKLEVVTVPVSDVDRGKELLPAVGMAGRRGHRGRRRLSSGPSDTSPFVVLGCVREGPHHGRAGLRSTPATGRQRHRRGASRSH